MAVVVVGEAPFDQSTYEQVHRRVTPDDQLPEGCRVHIAGPSSSGGWRVITVWDSEEQYQQFRDETLIPAMQEAVGGDLEGPPAEVQPVHRHITA